MDHKLLGVPFLVWSGVCLLLAVVWVFVWPHKAGLAVDSPRWLILRWGHALAWLLLALSALLAHFALPTLARLVGWAALASYLMFMVTSVTTK